MKPWRKIVFWLGLAAFIACMAWTLLSAERPNKEFTNILNSTNFKVTNSLSTPWFKFRVLKPSSEQGYGMYEWASTSPTNIEVICTHEPVITGPTNGEWTIRFK